MVNSPLLFSLILIAIYKNFLNPKFPKAPSGILMFKKKKNTSSLHFHNNKDVSSRNNNNNNNKLFPKVLLVAGLKQSPDLVGCCGHAAFGPLPKKTSKKKN